MLRMRIFTHVNDSNTIDATSLYYRRKNINIYENCEEKCKIFCKQRFEA